MERKKNGKFKKIASTCLFSREIEGKVLKQV